MKNIDPTSAAASPDATIKVEVVLALPERAWSVSLSLPAIATVGEALQLARPQLPPLNQTSPQDQPHWSYGIFGRLVKPDTLLRDGDRIELLRPLLADPMDQRRRRAAGNPLMTKKD